MPVLIDVARPSYWSSAMPGTSVPKKFPNAAGLPYCWISEMASMPMYCCICCATGMLISSRVLTKPLSCGLGACSSGTRVSREYCITVVMYDSRSVGAGVTEVFLW